MEAKVWTAKIQVKALPDPTSVERNNKNIRENQWEMSSISPKNIKENQAILSWNSSGNPDWVVDWVGR